MQAALEPANYDRALDLLQRKAGTTKARDEAFAGCARRGGAELARGAPGQEVITAPFDGVVGLRKVSIGDFVGVGQDMVNLGEQIDPLKADFGWRRSISARSGPGSDRARRRAFPGETFGGEVYAIR